MQNNDDIHAQLLLTILPIQWLLQLFLRFFINTCSNETAFLFYGTLIMPKCLEAVMLLCGKRKYGMPQVLNYLVKKMNIFDEFKNTIYFRTYLSE